MRHLALVCSLALLALVSLACAGSTEVSSETPPQAPDVATVPTPSVVESEGQALTVAQSGKASQTPELIDITASGKHLALRIPSARDDLSEDVARCAYPGLPDGVDGVDLALVDFEARSVQRWTIYRTPMMDDATCTDEAAARSELTLAKEAMQAAGLDPAQRQSWLLPASFEAGPEQLRRPRRESRAIELPTGEVLSVTLEHTSDSGYHTYSASVSGSAGIATATHSPNPGMAGSGDLEVRGAAATDGGTVVLFEARHGPGGVWSNWMLTPPQ
jgi:hypothetical protein